MAYEVELVSSEARQQVGLAHARIADHYHLEQVVVPLLDGLLRHGVGRPAENGGANPAGAENASLG